MSKHKHKEILGTFGAFGIGLKHFGTVWMRFEHFGILWEGFWQAREAREAGPGSLIPYVCMVCK